jgi:hypothetical protein
MLILAHRKAVALTTIISIDALSCLRRRADASGLECGLAAPEFSTIEWSASASCKSAVIFPRDDAIDLGAPFPHRCRRKAVANDSGKKKQLF